MSMYFCNKDKCSFCINNRGWRRIYRLAVMFGLMPKGTLPPETWSFDEPWEPMEYFTNEGQIVTASDALELANAIEWALTKLVKEDPDDDPEKKYGSDWENELDRRWKDAMSLGLKNPAYIFFNNRWEERLNELVHFCQQGEFVIY
ncbi:MAG: hypothetical protein Q8N39_10430 [Pelolinea sp.]|nr:hypothetical protein [Pelolinea sp.]